MDTTMVLTLIGANRPGTVEQIAQLIAARQGHWLKSALCSLGDKFASIVQIQVPTTQHHALVRDLKALEDTELQLLIADEQSALPAPGYPLTLRFIGLDRQGVVAEISAAISRLGVTIHSLNSHCAPAPMSSEILFHAEFELRVPDQMDCYRLCEALEALSPDLQVDWESDTALAV